MPVIDPAIVVHAPCTIHAMPRMAAKVLKLQHLDTLELLQAAFSMAQVCRGLFGTVPTNLHAVRILVLLHVAPVVYASHAMPVMFIWAAVLRVAYHRSPSNKLRPPPPKQKMA